MDEATILMDLSPALRGEVCFFLVDGGLLKHVSLFKHISSVYWPRVLPLLRPCPLMRGEVVCSEGEDCLEAFVVVEGQLIGTTSFGMDDVGNAVRSKADAPDDDELTAGSLSRSSSLESDTLEMVATKGKGPSGRGGGLVGSPSKGGGVGGGVGSDAPVVRRREVNMGQMVNTLCLVKVWDRSVEKVVAAERSESYAITAESFYNTFKDDGAMLRAVTEHLVSTQFCMDKDSPEKTTEWGVPLYVLTEAETEAKEVEFALELKLRKVEVRKHKKSAEKRVLGGGRGKGGLGGQDGGPGGQAAML